jgi:phenylacetic acid degradation operon negative regulatory protein
MEDRKVSAKDASTDRPLTARSVLASALLGEDPGRGLPVARLVALAGLFGINENQARVALSRMVGRKELTTRDGRYRLAGHLLERHSRQATSRAPLLRPWDGRWRLWIVTAERRSARERSVMRGALAGAHLAEMREGVWTRPNNLDVVLPPAIATMGRWAIAEIELRACDFWDLEGWAARATKLRRRLRVTLPALQNDRSDGLAPGFVLSAAVLRHLQADPLLPAELAPVGWPAAGLRADYDGWDRRYRTVLAGWHRTVVVAPASPDSSGVT